MNEKRHPRGEHGDRPHQRAELAAHEEVDHFQQRAPRLLDGSKVRGHRLASSVVLESPRSAAYPSDARRQQNVTAERVREA
jgi:hypothetical protein